MRISRFVLATVFAAVAAASGAAGGEELFTDIVDAAKRGDDNAVRRILERDPAAVRATDAEGYTALHWAGIRANWRIFAELVAAGAPVDAVGGDGGTPLHWACHHDRADMVQLLLDAGATLDIHNRWGRTPLHVAARRGCRSVAELLLARRRRPERGHGRGVDAAPRGLPQRSAGACRPPARARGRSRAAGRPGPAFRRGRT